MSKPQSLCVQPWIHLATWNDGSVPLCCIAQPEKDLNLNTHTLQEAWNSTQFKQVRLDFMSGKKPPQCSACWKEEAAGILSHREIENRVWERKLSSEYIDKLISSTNTDGSVDHNPITLDLRIGNTCNLQCVMCRPRDSSKWLADSRKLAATLTSSGARTDWKYKAESIASTSVFDWFSSLQTQGALQEFMGDIQHIIFGGGEPLMIKEHLTFITQLVESGHSKNITLRYHINGTQLTERFIELWNKFKRVELMISVDDWGKRNDYIRYPSDWDTIATNLDRLDETADNIVVTILATIHAMNIYNLPEFAIQVLNRGWQKIGKNNSGLFSVGTVHWPQYMSTRVLSPSVKKEVTTHWSKFTELADNPYWTSRITKQLEFMNGSDESSRFPDLLDYIEKLDLLRPFKFGDVYPEYYKLLAKHR
jgi:organic radical activating enzyme